MKIKVLYAGDPEPAQNNQQGMLQPQQSQQPQQAQMQQQGEPETLLNKLGRNIGSAGLKTASNLESFGSLADPIGNILGALGNLVNYGYQKFTGEQSPMQRYQNIIEQSPLNQYTPEILQAAGLIPKNYTEPRNAYEAVAQGTLSDLPFLLSGGSLRGLARAAGGALVGNVAETGLKEAGQGTLTQTAGKIGAQGLLSLAIKGLVPGKVRKHAQTKMKEEYTKADKVAKEVNWDGKKLEDSLDEELNVLYGKKSGLNDVDAKKVRSQLGYAHADIQAGKINLKDATDRVKHLKSLITDEKNRKISDYYKKAVDTINNAVIEPAGKKYESFGNPYNAATDWDRGLNAPSIIRKYLEEHDLGKLIKSPFAKVGLLGGGTSLLFKPHLIPKAALGAAGAAGGAYGARAVARGVDLFAKSSQAKKYYMEMVKAAANDNKDAVVNNLKKFNLLAQKFEEKYKEQEPAKEKPQKKEEKGLKINVKYAGD